MNVSVSRQPAGVGASPVMTSLSELTVYHPLLAATYLNSCRNIIQMHQFSVK